MPSKVYYEMGRYWGRVTHQKLGKTKNGNPQLVISFLVLGKINAMDPEGDLLAVSQQYERTVFRVITENTIEWVEQDLDKLGWTGTDWSQFDETNPHCVSFVGTELAFSCKHEPHFETKEPREVWSVSQESPGMAVTPLEPSELRKLNTMFGKALKERKPPSPKAESPRKSPEPTSATPPKTLTPDEVKAELAAADDVPF